MIQAGMPQATQCRKRRTPVRQHAINMMYGEVYGYAHYMQQNYFIPRNVKFLWYDVVCKYWPWLKKQNKEVSEKMKPALSVMHAKAHAWYCQVGTVNNYVKIDLFKL